MQQYDVTYNGEVVGTVYLTNEGLYTRFQCQCQLPDTQIYRLHMICGDQEMDLGICVPMGTRFVVNKSCQRKQIAQGEKLFRIVAASQMRSECFVPISNDVMFDGISMLEYARLKYQGGQYGILFDNQPKSI